jgi:hypothetical protein
MAASAVRSGLILATVHSVIVLAVLLKVLTLEDPTARWGASMMLAWTIDIWLVPLYSVAELDWEVPSFFTFSFLGGGLVYFVIGYGANWLWLKLRRGSSA